LAISYAQTAGGADAGTGGAQQRGGPMNWMKYKMMDEMYDGFPDFYDMGDMFDFGDMGDYLEDMSEGMFGMDVEDLFGYGAMMMQGAMNGQMPQMPDMSKMMGGMMPQGMGSNPMMMAAMMDEGDMMDGMEDMMKYGMGMGMMRGAGGAAQQQPTSGTTMLRMPHRRMRRRPSRLLSRPRVHKKLRKPREFMPFINWNMFGTTGNQAQQAISPYMGMFGYDGIDSEDRAAMIMMGANPNNMPPPMDGIDGEDMWMYRGTKYDPMNYFKKATTSTTTSTDGSNAGASTSTSRFNPMMFWPYFSSLQRRHVKYWTVNFEKSINGLLNLKRARG